MPLFQLSITFLNGTFQGRGDGDSPEWPPSPMRVFQALVATAGRMYPGDFQNPVTDALNWLAELPAPVIDTPPHRFSTPIRLSVPNNAMDICAQRWSRGNYDSKEAKESTHKTMKTIAPTVLMNSDVLENRVTYSWQVSVEATEEPHCKTISMLARNLVCLGWGSDLVAGHATLLLEDVPQRSSNHVSWQPNADQNTRLHVANASTLTALQRRHRVSLHRVIGDTLQPVPAIPPSAFRSVGYGRTWDVARLPFAVFSLLDLSTDKFARFPTRKGSEVAGMTRHITANAAKSTGWDEKKIRRFLYGHAEANGATHQSVNLDRLAYVPLPSIEPRKNRGCAVGMIRRVLVYSPAHGYDSEIEWVRRSLSGLDLIREKTNQVAATLSAIPERDNIVQQYAPKNGATTWTSVTPIVLPRNYMRRQDTQKLKSANSDEKKQLLAARDERILSLIRRSIIQAGYDKKLADAANITWRKVGYLRGADRGDDYFIPKHLRKYPTVHVRISWRDPFGNPVSIPGPIVLGAGRFYGLGLVVAIDDT